MKKYILGSLLGLVAFAIVGGTVALARGGFGPGFEGKAEVLGITTEELQIQLEDKSMAQILDEQGITHQQLYELRQQERLEEQADLLGITVEELQSELETKTFAQLLDQRGISHAEVMNQRRAQHQERMQEYLQQMVDEGTITEEQMQERLDHTAVHESRGFGRGHRGLMMEL